MDKFHEPAIVELRRPTEREEPAKGETRPEPVLVPGDQVAFLDAGRGLSLVTTDLGGEDPYYDVFWLTLRNTPTETTHRWGQPIPHGSVLLDFEGGHDLPVMPIPRVLARKKIR